jgi:FixJ family two-component response regulator
LSQLIGEERDGVRQTGRIVYIVDDEQIIAQTLAMILSHAGFRTTAFKIRFWL